MSESLSSAVESESLLPPASSADSLEDEGEVVVNSIGPEEDEKHSLLNTVPRHRRTNTTPGVCDLLCSRGPLIAIMLALLSFGFLLSLPSLILAQTGGSNNVTGTGYVSTTGNGTQPGADGKYYIQAEGIRLGFVPYGASISNCFIFDKSGVERDIIVAWDNASYYSNPKALHGHFGAVPGRYANRIKNSTFTIDGVTSHVFPNENNNTDTLHGGPHGWDWRNWTVVSHTTDSVTFSLFDADGEQGFPGDVVSYVTYTASPFTWHIRMTALSLTKTTPIMLSSHSYWNLDGFANPDSDTALNHTLHLPYSGQRIDITTTQIPTGNILNNAPYSVSDFYTVPKQIGANLTSPELVNYCGKNCTGYDTAFLVNRGGVAPSAPSNGGGAYDWRTNGPVATLASEFSGISFDIYTDQQAMQVYTCNNSNGTMPIKTTQGLTDGSRPRVVQKYGCVVLEVEDWIAGVNYPEWGRRARQVFGPGDEPYSLNAVYRFSVADDGSAGYDQTYGAMKKRKV